LFLLLFCLCFCFCMCSVLVVFVLVLVIVLVVGFHLITCWERDGKCWVFKLKIEFLRITKQQQESNKVPLASRGPQNQNRNQTESTPIRIGIPRRICCMRYDTISPPSYSDLALPQVPYQPYKPCPISHIPFFSPTLSISRIIAAGFVSLHCINFAN